MNHRLQISTNSEPGQPRKHVRATPVRALCLGLTVALSACAASKTNQVAGGVEGLQTDLQKRQAQRFAINELLGTRTGQELAESPGAPEPVTQHVANPAPCDSGPFLLRQLPSTEFRLSNQRVEAVAQMLTTMGYSVIGPPEGEQVRARKYGCAELPIVMRPFSAPDNLFTIQEERARDYVRGGSFGFSPLRQGSSEDLDRMVVFYHPSQEDDLRLLESALRYDLDTASPQVFLETLVVEVNREDSEELGLDWENANVARSSLLSFGALTPGLDDAVDFVRDTRRGPGIDSFDPGEGVRFRLRALVENGRAQVLSRPSVLALSNRQAVIQIVDVIQTPNLSTRVDINGNFTVSDFSFEPLLIGITLNLRPRVSADRKWVSMEIDATVDAEVDENSGDVFSTDGNGNRVQLASKPGLSSRKVRTFTRIPDRTPIIIGGLAAANSEQIKSRVPFLGKLPFFGALFGATDNEVQEREIIIVLTPYVLDEQDRGVGSNGYLGNLANPPAEVTVEQIDSGGSSRHEAPDAYAVRAGASGPSGNALGFQDTPAFGGQPPSTAPGSFGFEPPSFDDYPDESTGDDFYGAPSPPPESGVP